MEAFDKMKSRAEKAEAFKAWTHKYLDDKGVPSTVEDEHLAAGCRIGGRMDWVFAKLEAHEARDIQLRGLLHEIIDDARCWDVDVSGDPARGCGFCHVCVALKALALLGDKKS